MGSLMLKPLSFQSDRMLDDAFSYTPSRAFERFPKPAAQERIEATGQLRFKRFLDECANLPQPFHAPRGGGRRK